MTVVKMECYRVVCTSCGCDLEDGDGILRHYDCLGEAESLAIDYDWIVWDGYHWCERLNCQPLCVCGHRFNEHDDGGDDLGPCLFSDFDDGTVCVNQCEGFRLQEKAE